MEEELHLGRVFDAVKGYVDRGFARVVARLTELEKASEPNLAKRVAALEKVGQPGTHYRGVWNQGEQYSPGDLATYAGTLWHCGTATATKPGTSSSWQMMVKSERRP